MYPNRFPITYRSDNFLKNTKILVAFAEIPSLCAQRNVFYKKDIAEKKITLGASPSRE